MPTLYDLDLSPPCRLVKLVAKTIGMELELKNCNLFAGEHMTEEYRKMNPQHTVPFLVDGDLGLSESRAIACYLINQYSPDHKLYPQDAKRRATIDRFLNWDNGSFYKALLDFVLPKFKGGELATEHEGRVKDMMKMLEEFLGARSFITGEEATLADLCLGVSLSLLVAVNWSGFADFPKAQQYFGRVSAQPHFKDIMKPPQ